MVFGREETVKKVLVYLISAVVLGLLVVLVPLITVVTIEPVSFTRANSLSEGMKTLDKQAFDSNSQTQTLAPVAAPAIPVTSFVVALVAYVVLKRKSAIFE